jgi:hypothetical protein
LDKSDITLAIKTNPILSGCISIVQEAHPELVGILPVTTVVEQMEASVKVTIVFEVKGQKERVVVVKKQDSATATIIEDVAILPIVIKPITSVVKTNVTTGLVTKISNDLATVAEYLTTITQLINDIKIKVPTLNTEQIEYIQTTEMTSANQITVISETNGVTVKVDFTVNKITGKINVIDVIEKPAVPITCLPPVIQPEIEVLPEDYEEPVIVGCIGAVIEGSGY